MEYLYEIAWLMLWPVVIYLGWRFSAKNALKFEEKIK
jgi:hypothetical protein